MTPTRAPFDERRVCNMESCVPVATLNAAVISLRRLVYILLVAFLGLGVVSSYAESNYRALSKDVVKLEEAIKVLPTIKESLIRIEEQLKQGRGNG